MNLLPKFPYKSFIFTAILNSHNELGPPVMLPKNAEKKKKLLGVVR